MTPWQKILEVVSFPWSKKGGFKKFLVYQPSDEDKISDSQQPVDRYGIGHGKGCIGACNLSDQTVWVAALNVNFFGK
jgi:hypothetical protein